MGRATRDPIDLPVLQDGHQPWPLNGVRCAVAELALVVVAPGEDFAGIGARNAVQRPGLAKMFFESASEERTHALAMLDYVRMRGLNTLSLLPESLVTFFFLFFSCDHRQKDL